MAVNREMLMNRFEEFVKKFKEWCKREVRGKPEVQLFGDAGIAECVISEGVATSIVPYVHSFADIIDEYKDVIQRKHIDVHLVSLGEFRKGDYVEHASLRYDPIGDVYDVDVEMYSCKAVGELENVDHPTEWGSVYGMEYQGFGDVVWDGLFWVGRGVVSVRDIKDIKELDYDDLEKLIKLLAYKAVELSSRAIKSMIKKED